MSSNRVVDLRNRAVRAARTTSPLRFSEKKQRTPLRARRRRTRVILGSVCALLFGAALWGVSYVSYLPQFTVREVTVTGATRVAPRLVQAYVETRIYAGEHPFISPENIFMLNPKRIAREIVGFFPRIKSAEVTRESMFATAVSVSVVERQPFARWCEGLRCFFLDGDGFIFSEVPEDASSTPAHLQQYVFEGGMASSSSPIGHAFAPAQFSGILALLQMLSQANLAPRGATLISDQDFSVLLTGGYYLKASFGADASLLIRNLRLVLTSEALQDKQDDIEYIDLRFGNRVYYKLKGEVEAKVSSS